MYKQIRNIWTSSLPQTVRVTHPRSSFLANYKFRAAQRERVSTDYAAAGSLHQFGRDIRQDQRRFGDDFDAKQHALINPGAL